MTSTVEIFGNFSFVWAHSVLISEMIALHHPQLIRLISQKSCILSWMSRRRITSGSRYLCLTRRC